MNEQNILNVANRWEFRAWLEAHASAETECWVAVKRGRPSAPEVFYYLDAVEEALCFGWVDSVQKQIDGKRMQRFSPRKSNSPWTELNKARVRRLESLGRMTDAGRAVLPAMGPRSFRVDREIEAAMKAARVWSKFRSFPALYQRVRAYNVAFYKKASGTTTGGCPMTERGGVLHVEMSQMRPGVQQAGPGSLLYETANH